MHGPLSRLVADASCRLGAGRGHVLWSFQSRLGLVSLCKTCFVRFSVYRMSAEAESLRRGGILGDAEWAMLPLALTIPPSPLLPPLEPSKSLLPQSQHNMHPPPPGSLVPPSWLRTASWGGERSAAGAGVRRSSPSAAPSASDRAVTESVSGEAQGGGASFARMKREALRLARERAFLLARYS
jgi:hypothetical protein